MAHLLRHKFEKRKIGKIEVFMHTKVVLKKYLLCDGAEISRELYPHLFKEIGTSFGPGNGTTTFNLPNLQGQFLRGLDNGAGIDPDGATREVGSTQLYDTERHRHYGGYVAGSWRGGGRSGGAGKYTSQYRMNTNSTGGNETRPTNTAVDYYIRCEA